MIRILVDIILVLAATALFLGTAFSFFNEIAEDYRRVIRSRKEKRGGRDGQ